MIFLLFVGLATLFWWGQAMSTPREYTIQVPVTYTGYDGSIVFEKPLPNEIEITVRDNGQQLRAIKKQKLNLNINLEHLLSNNKLLISAEVLRPRLQEILPGSTSIQHTQPEYIEVNYRVQQKKIVPVELISIIELVPQYQLAHAPEISPSEVKIYGSTAQLDSITKIITDSVHLIDLQQSILKEVPLIAPKGVRVEPSTVQVAWEVEQFTEKSFRLPLQVEGISRGEKIRLFPSEVEAIVRVGISQFEKIEADDLQAVCPYPTAQDKKLTVEIRSTNPYITSSRAIPAHVEYIIER